jgi:hypothetical protein
MDRQVATSKGGLAQEMQGQFMMCMERVMAAVEAAPEGQMIEASEVPVHTLMREFERQVYQTALQARAKACEPAAAKSPAAFSPSGRGSGT